MSAILQGYPSSPPPYLQSQDNGPGSEKSNKRTRASDADADDSNDEERYFLTNQPHAHATPRACACYSNRTHLLCRMHPHVFLISRVHCITHAVAHASPITPRLNLVLALTVTLTVVLNLNLTPRPSAKKIQCIDLTNAEKIQCIDLTNEG